MLVENGKILHIDFGFIMSKEPPAKSGPPIKLCAEMVKNLNLKFKILFWFYILYLFYFSSL